MRKTWHLMMLVAAVAGLLAACAVRPDRNAAREKDKILWPAPPDQPRFKFAGILRSASDIVRETDDEKQMRGMLGKSGPSDKPAIDKLTGIASRFGMLYAVEPAAKAITVFDMQRGKLFRFGLREPNALSRPLAVAVDREGLVYVLDAGLRKVMVFDAMGLFLRAIELRDALLNPVAVAVDPAGTKIYVVDRGDLASNEHKVVAYAADGKELFRLGPRGGADGMFNIPIAAAVADDGTLYVADAGNFRIQAFDATGKFKFKFGEPGAGPGTFSRPRWIDLDPAGNIYVADAAFNNVQIFNSQGQLLMPLGGLNRNPGPGHYALLGGLAVDELGRLFIGDNYFKKIEMFLPLSEAEGRRLMTEN